MKTDELKIKLTNIHWRLNEFGDILGDLLGVNEFDFIAPEERIEPETKTIHVIIEKESEKKKNTPLEEMWEI